MCTCVSPVCISTCHVVVQGNYDQYVKTREELEENQMKRFNWEQDQIAHMKVDEESHIFLTSTLGFNL